MHQFLKSPPFGFIKFISLYKKWNVYNHFSLKNITSKNFEFTFEKKLVLY